MDLKLTDKVAVVTGANKGIGFAVTHALLAEGAHVVAGSRTTANLDGIERVTAVAVDLVTEDGPALLVQRAIDEHGRVDVLVNNVGAVRIRLDGFLGTSDEEFQWALETDFFTTLRATRAALGPMLAQGSGAIVNVASVNSFFQPDAATIDYGVAKAAVVNLSKSLSQEFSPRGIRVNCVSPGQVSTDLWLGQHGVAETIGKAIGVDADAVRQTAVASIATGRFTTPGEVATLITMLASEALGNVTGANYVIDGGLVKRRSLVTQVSAALIPDAELAITVHVGPHTAGVDRAYGSLATYVTDHALAIEGPIREYYVIGPHETHDENEWRTEIGWPIFHLGARQGRPRRGP